MSQSPDLHQVFYTAFDLLKVSVEAGKIPGGVLGIHDLKHGRLTRAVGLAQKEPDQRDMTVETWFDLASLTKVIFTTPRILGLAARGVIDLDQPITTVIPDFRQYAPDAWERAVTFRQCLGHRTAFPAVEPIYTYGGDPDRLRAFVLQREWKAGPSVYSDINFILLGIALERLTGETIRAMDPGPGFSFTPDPAITAATERCAWRGRVLVGEVHDENCFALQGSGHAGLFGTVDAVLDFAKGVLEDDAKSDEIVKLMRTPVSATRTHGWERPYRGWSGGDHCNGSVIGHTGFTGVALWVDFDNGRTWTLLTNRVHPTRHFDSGILGLRAGVSNAINATNGRTA